MAGPKLSREQQEAVDYVLSSEDHVFITGRAGTGKSTVLRELRQRLGERCIVSASTGIAALHVNGRTLHSVVGVGTSLPADAYIDLPKVSQRRGRELRGIDTLIIDEVSMVDADLLDAVDRTLQHIRHDTAPFGGLRLVFFGDLYQLPPVVTKDSRNYFQRAKYRSEWFFDAEVWQDTHFSTIELMEVHRQADQGFSDVLNKVRDGSIGQDELNMLNAVGVKRDSPDSAILLASTNSMVQSYNMAKLNEIPGREHVYRARVNTGFGRNEPAPRELHLKNGAHVMLLSNESGGQWVNGSRGVLENCWDEDISVMLQDGTPCSVGTHAWVPSNTHPDDYPTAPKYWQLPVKLAWAMTIHKAQGMSMNEIDVEVGPSGAFADGQVYVALSRVTTPEGLYIRTPLQLTDIRVNKDVKRFFKSIHAYN